MALKEEYAALLKIAEDAKDLLNAIKEGMGNDAYCTLEIDIANWEAKRKEA
jgi:hypothetical protein